jgi:hypothetical protein
MGMTEAVSQVRKGLQLLSGLPKSAARQQQELNLQIALGRAQLAASTPARTLRSADRIEVTSLSTSTPCSPAPRSAPGLAARPLFPGRQRRDWDGAPPSAHCGAFALPFCCVALWLFCQLLRSAVPSGFPLGSD